MSANENNENLKSNAGLPEKNEAIQAKEISFGYEPFSRKKIVSPFLSVQSLSIPKNKITAILGPNGSGKSTLLKLLCGIKKPWSGEIFLLGKALSKTTNEERARTISFVSQTAGIPDILTKNLVLHGRFPHAKSFFFQNYSKSDEEKAMSAMEKMNIASLAEKNVKNLSSGQRQRAFIALALAQDTPILVLDEPFTYLDIREQLELSEKLKSLGKTVIIVVHDIPLALEISDNIAVMEGGRIKKCGQPQEILESKVLESVFGVRIQKKETISFSI